MHILQTNFAHFLLAALVLFPIACQPTVSSATEFTHPDCRECVFPLPIGSTIYGKDKMARFRIETAADLEFSEVNNIYIQKLPEYGWTIESSKGSPGWTEYDVTNGSRRFTLFVTQTDPGRPVEISLIK